MSGNKFKAIIVGGSVAGLTLAHTFDSAGIDYVLLEGRDTVIPASGATIVIMPNGARILDQLGVYEQMEEIFQPMISTTTWKSDGRFMSKTDWPTIIRERFGYPPTVFKRQRFLQSLLKQLKSKEKILLNKRVINITHSSDSVSVQCADGSKFVADIVVGADGIHSRVRQEMQRISEESSPGLMDRDKECITAEYQCIFGVSEPITSLQPGETHTSSDVDHSSLLFVGKDSLPQWFFISKMDQKYRGSSIPRFTESQKDEMINKHKDHMFKEGVSFANLIKTTSTMGFLALEEARHRFWTHGRIVCVGDSVHKMTPNLGQGGNQAIESAVVLTNCLEELIGLDSTEHPSISALTPILQKYQDLRRDRANLMVNISAGLTRYEALATLGHTIHFLFKPAISTEILADLQTGWYSNAPSLHHLPPAKGQEENDVWQEEDYTPPTQLKLRAQL